ncbi:hypothetical protein [Streptomyces melanosporofaciens]|uniref:Uncharacterized protein n=1 Tax=Streptomyces melanosporofaciens TaxID=67327 RepID=A0A1H4IA08_STRMJ|nr:hypothetical protein [Streptomyces melanosporofaciens]SEB30760.1 hypothetical protein SAMN04490356_0285 [Streptomyces melanosporofaciens]
MLTALADDRRHTLDWRSARRRARARVAKVTTPPCPLHQYQAKRAVLDAPAREGRDLLRENALMRTDLARFQTLVERAGWLGDAEPRRLWRWRESWWELAYRKRNPKDGYSDSGWYLWGPTGSPLRRLDRPPESRRVACS